MSNDNKKLQKSINNVALKDAINAQAELYNGKVEVLGLSGLTWNSYISSARAIMANTHAQHARNLIYPENPKMETGLEKMAGDLSTSYKKAERELEVFAIVPRFNIEGKEKHLYLMFLYDREKDKYSVVEKKNIEDLTEKFGYLYNNKNMDSKDVGDAFKKGETILASNSYDEYGNYRRGINARTGFFIDNDTIEDAMKISESLRDRLSTIESDSVRIPLNGNDILKNLYGKGDSYKGFPDIGERIKNGVLAASLRKHNDQVLYTMNSKNLRSINYSSDTPYYCDGVIEDIVIYSNKQMDEIPDDQFNAQIKFYLGLQNEFYTKVLEVTDEILKSGSEFTTDITFWYQKSKDVLNPMVLYKTEENRKFDNFIIEFLVSRVVKANIGDKIAGRAGNKGVISAIVPDDEMPILETGERVDLILNTLGVVNRLSSQIILEQSVNFIGNRSLERIAKMETYKEKDEFLVKILSYFNEEQSEKMKSFLKKVDDKEEFYQRLDIVGIIFRIPPMWDTVPLLDRLTKFYKENDWIKPYKVFIKRFDRWVRIMNDLYIGDIYILKLKQNSSKGLIARSTGSISKRGIPVKSKKPHKEPFSKTPIRIGDGENSNFGIGMPSSVIAKMHLFYRNSPVARQVLGESLSTEVDGLTDIEVTDMMTNRNAEIFNAYLKFKGMKLEFHDRYEYISAFNDRTKRTIEIDENQFFVGTDREIVKEGIRREVLANAKAKDGVLRVQTSAQRKKEVDGEVERIFNERFKKNRFNK